MNQRLAFTLSEGDIIAKRGLECRVVSMAPVVIYGNITTKIVLERTNGELFVVNVYGDTWPTIETDHKGWKLIRRNGS